MILPAFTPQELAYRRELRYPPFVHMVRFEIRDTNSDKAEQAALEAYSTVWNAW